MKDDDDDDDDDDNDDGDKIIYNLYHNHNSGAPPARSARVDGAP